MTALPRIQTYRHRDSGRVFKVFGDLWQIEVCYARRRRNQWGVRQPFTVTVTLYEAGE